MPILSWMKKQKEDGSESLEVSLPDEQKKAIDDALKAGAANSKALESVLENLNKINARFASEEDERKKRETEAARRKAAEDAGKGEEELNELFLTDPAAATKKLLEATLGGRDTALMTLRADNLKREIFEDGEKFPYYSGDIKSEIDKLLEGQTLAHRNDRGVIENAYYSVLGRHTKEMQEGKLKSRFASPEATRGTGSGNTDGGSGHTGPRRMNDDERRVAAMLGFKEEDYGKMLDDAGIGMV